MAKFFEVQFRSENEKKLQTYWPEGGRIGCTAIEARQRHDDLVEAGEAKETIDGVVPYVVEVIAVHVTTKKLAPVDGNGKVGKRRRVGVRKAKSVLLSFIDGPNDVTQRGPWAINVPEPDPATLN